MARIALPEGDYEEPYRLFTMAPAVAGPAGAYSDAVYNRSSLPLRLRELLRMRIAQINQCMVCLDARVADPSANGLDEDIYANVENWATYPGFTPAERAAIDYTTRFATDHLSIDQAFLDELVGHFGEELLFEITLCVGAWLALGRTMQVFGAAMSCPMTV